MTYLYPLPAVALLMVPAVAPRWTEGRQGALWLAAVGLASVGAVVALLPDLDSAGALIGTLSLALAMPAAVVLGLGLVSAWSWRRLLPVAAILGAALLSLTSPALAADPSILPPELIGTAGPMAYVVAGLAVLKFLGIIGDKGITIRVSHDLSEESITRLAVLLRRVEVHPAPEPDPLAEPSGTRQAPRSPTRR